jgi:hypothetical protein
MMTQADKFDVQDLPPYLQGNGDSAVQTVAMGSVSSGNTLEEQERILVVQALEAANGNQSEAAREHGGFIRLQSEPGAGARFTFTIPWEQTSEAARSSSS